MFYPLLHHWCSNTPKILGIQTSVKTFAFSWVTDPKYCPLAACVRSWSQISDRTASQTKSGNRCATPVSNGLELSHPSKRPSSDSHRTQTSSINICGVCLNGRANAWGYLRPRTISRAANIHKSSCRRKATRGRAPLNTRSSNYHMLGLFFH